MGPKYKKTLIISIIITGCTLFSYLAGYLLNCIIHRGGIMLNKVLLTDNTTLLYTLEMFMLILLTALILYLRHETLYSHKNVIEGKSRDKHISANLEESRWQSNAEIKSNYTYLNFNELKYSKAEGIPLSAEYRKGKLNISLAKPIHTLVIGTTGSGKTSAYINPTIQILSESSNKPSMVISDPKGELLETHYNKLAKSKYEIYVLDFRNPYNSTKWNPLLRPYLNYQKMLNLHDEVVSKVHNDIAVKIFNETLYTDEQKLNLAVQIEKQKLYDDVYEDLHDIACALCPIKSHSDPIWDSGARNFILAILLAMLEDSADGRLNMTADKYNFFNLTKIASHTDNDCKDLISYFSGRSPLSQCVTLSKQVMDATDKTRLSYLSTVLDRLSIFSDKSICSLTSANEIDFEKLPDKPSALFLQIPDEKETRHPLASIAILQAYKELVRKASSMEGLTLSRSVYFLLEEFGNLPKIEKLEQMITVGRSRKIWLVLVVQSYAQLYKVYGDKEAEIIKSNCNIQVFIGTTDQKTREEFSKLCGNYSVITRNVSSDTAKLASIHSSSSVRERPLIYPSELQLLNNGKDVMGNAIVCVFGYYPIKSKFTPSFLCPLYDTKKWDSTLKAGSYFDENNIFYNITKRNKIASLEKSAKNHNEKHIKPGMPVYLIKNRMEKCLGSLCSDNEINEIIKLLHGKKHTQIKELLQNYHARAKDADNFYAMESIEGLIAEFNAMSIKQEGYYD